MRAKIFIIGIGLVLIYVYFIYNPIIIDKTEKEFSENDDFIIRNNQVKILNHLNFEDNDRCQAVLIINEREDISGDLSFGHVFSSSDKKLIKKLSTINFKYTGSDVATVENEIIIYKNSKIVFRSGIVIDKNKEDLQHSDFGWITTKSGRLAKIFSQFNRNFTPVIVILH